MTDLELISIRLARMENRFRWIKRAAILICIVIAGGVIMAQVPRPLQVPNGLDQLDELKQLPRDRPLSQQQALATVESEVRSQHFILVDAKGKERASLVADGAGSVFLVMFDAGGKTRANLSVSNDGPSLTFYDPSGQARTVVGSTTLVPSHVNDNGIAEKAPPSSVVLFDRSGKLLFRQP
jgi:hypothetical protein